MDPAYDLLNVLGGGIGRGIVLAVAALVVVALAIAWMDGTMASAPTTRSRGPIRAARPDSAGAPSRKDARNPAARCPFTRTERR